MKHRFQAFWDSTGGLWAKGALAGKYAGAFVSTGTPGGGQEMTTLNMMSTFAHHGIIFVPLGYSNTFPQLTNLTEVHGGEYLHLHTSLDFDFAPLTPRSFFVGSPWGAGTFAGGDGSRQATVLEREIAHIQGKSFWETVSKVKFRN